MPKPPDQDKSPKVRIAMCNDQTNRKQPRYDNALRSTVNLAVARDSPKVRLALSGQAGEETGKNKVIRPKALGEAYPQIKLAHISGAQGDNNLLGQRGIEALPEGRRPALLISYYYLEGFLKNQSKYCYRDWVMDSGAFSAFNSGKVINLQDYIDCCKKLLIEDSTLTEVYSLDVIGDWKASLKNVEEMWKQGVPAIPCFHYGEPWDLLIGLAKDYPKIALGGFISSTEDGHTRTRRDRSKFAGQCFARVWPKKIHGFGCGTEKLLMELPFHSADATGWEIRPCKYGIWNAFGGERVSVKGSTQNLRAEIEWYLDLEERIQLRWKKEMALLETQDPQQSLQSPTVRLADETDSRTEAKIEAFKPRKK
jgi:hypothetical protein